MAFNISPNLNVLKMNKIKKKINKKNFLMILTFFGIVFKVLPKQKIIRTIQFTKYIHGSYITTVVM